MINLVYAIISLCYGLYFIIFGIRLFKPTLFIIATLLVNMSSLAIYNKLEQIYTFTNSLFYFIGTGINDVFVGLLFLLYYKLGLLALGLLSGLSIASYVVNILSFLECDRMYINSAILVVCIISGGLISIMFEKSILIIGTSLIGSTLCWFSFMLFKQYDQDHFEYFIDYYMIFGIPVMALISCVFQYKLFCSISKTTKSL